MKTVIREITKRQDIKMKILFFLQKNYLRTPMVD